MIDYEDIRTVGRQLKVKRPITTTNKNEKQQILGMKVPQEGSEHTSSHFIQITLLQSYKISGYIHSLPTAKIER